MTTLQVQCVLPSRTVHTVVLNGYTDALDVWNVYKDTPGMRAVELRERTESGDWITLKTWARL
jgi:hypothetical protein